MNCCTRVSNKKCQVRVSSKSVLQECLTRVSRKSVLQERQVRVSSKGVLQECHLSVWIQGVSQVSLLEMWQISSVPVCQHTCRHSGSWASSCFFSACDQEASTRFHLLTQETLMIVKNLGILQTSNCHIYSVSSGWELGCVFTESQSIQSPLCFVLKELTVQVLFARERPWSSVALHLPKRQEGAGLKVWNPQKKTGDFNIFDFWWPWSQACSWCLQIPFCEIWHS